MIGSCYFIVVLRQKKPNQLPTLLFNYMSVSKIKAAHLTIDVLGKIIEHKAVDVQTGGGLAYFISISGILTILCDRKMCRKNKANSTQTVPLTKHLVMYSISGQIKEMTKSKTSRNLIMKLPSLRIVLASSFRRD